MPYSVQWHSDM